MIEIALLSDQPIIQAGFRSVVGEFDGISLSGVFSTREDAKTQLPSLNADVLLVDWGPDWDPLLVPDLAACVPGVKIILLVRRPAPEFVIQAQETGANGLLDTASSPENVRAALQRMGRDDAGFEGAEIRAVAGAKRVRLAPREGQLVSLLAQGLKNKEIAHQLGITEGTVKVYLSKLFRKVGAKDRFELALFGLKNLAGSGIQGGTQERVESHGVVTGPKSLVLRHPAPVSAGPAPGPMIAARQSAAQVRIPCGSYAPYSDTAARSIPGAVTAARPVSLLAS